MSTRVLVCDDDGQIRRALRVVLTAEGYEVAETATAEEALDAAAVSSPDLAILDLGLPDHDGVWVCERLREWGSMPIIVLSVVEEETEKVRALEAGADDYLTKPFGCAELVARVEAALRRVDRGGEPIVSTEGGLEIDLQGHTVMRDGELVHLTPTEFRLLKTLVADRGRLLTHGKLLTEVWGPGYADDIHVLRIHMVNLRRKIEPDPARPTLILTDPGVGYRFMG